mgnify:FL=1
MTYGCMLGKEFHWRRGQWLPSTKYGEAKARIGLIHMNVETEMLRIVLQAVLCRRNMDNQANGSGQIAGIRNAMLQKITEHPMAAENYECHVRRRMNNTENFVQAVIRGKIELFMTYFVKCGAEEWYCKWYLVQWVEKNRKLS